MDSEDIKRRLEFARKNGQDPRLEWINCMILICDKACIRRGENPLSQKIIEYQQAQLESYLKMMAEAGNRERYAERARSMNRPGF